MAELLAERKFTVGTQRQRVWSLLGRVIFDSLQLERFHARDDRNFDALLRVKLAFFSLPMQVEGLMADISPPESLTVLLEVRGLRIIQLSQKVTIALSQAEGGKTEVACKASMERMSAFFRPFLIGKAKSLGGQVLGNLEENLQRLA